MPTTNIDKLYLGDILLCGGGSATSSSIGFSVSNTKDVISVQSMDADIIYYQYFVMSNSGVIETDL